MYLYRHEIGKESGCNCACCGDKQRYNRSWEMFFGEHEDDENHGETKYKEVGCKEREC